MNSLNGPAEISADIKMLFDTFRATVMMPTPHLAVYMCRRLGEKERAESVGRLFTILNNKCNNVIISHTYVTHVTLNTATMYLQNRKVSS